uniref:SfiI-subtelomeric related protein family member n=1 Tax=Theileria annulata TaxID=5874 RepID=A0A3B0MEZ4_THEAN
MKNTYTFLLYLGIGLFVLSSNCFELDIGQISKYRKGGNEINVTRDENNFYKHQPYEPFLLKELYYDDELIYFDPLLTSDQLLISASVLWVSDNPTVIHLNLEKSTIMLLNENKSSLSVEAIFSGGNISNINHKFHPGSDNAVDIDIKQTQNYTSNSLNVSVNQLHLSGNGLEKFVLRYYDLGSYKLNNLKYGNDDLKTVTETSTPNKEVILEVPNKEQVYGVYVYSYNDFPLMIELVYTYNKRLYYGNCTVRKWHKLLMVPLNDPSYYENLLNKLNYYACKNGFKITIDADRKAEEDQGYYDIDNYCLGPNGVEPVLNRLDLKLIKHGEHYSCNIHKALNDRKFFTDNLYYENSIFELQNLPKKIDCIRVYRIKDTKPCLITIVSKNSMLYYKREGDSWKYLNTDENLTDINNEFNEKINVLLYEFDPDEKCEENLIDHEWKKEPKLNLNEETVKSLPDNVTIKVQGDETYEMPTLKYDNKQLKSKILKRFQFDIYSYMDGKQKSCLIINGDLESKIVVETKPFRALIAIYYDGRPIIEFEKEDVLIHKAIYFYDKNNHDMNVYLYTNSLYVYHFRNNYYKYDYRWELVSKEPVTLADSHQTNQNLINYFEQVKRLNTADTQKPKEITVTNEAIDLMTNEEVAILTRNYAKENIDTIKRDQSKNIDTEREIDISKLNPSSCTNKFGYFKIIKENEKKILELTDTLNHFVKLIEYSKEDDELNLYLYTNTLYVFRFQKKPNDNEWKFIILQPVMCLYKNVSEPLKPYFTKMNEINKFDYNVDIYEEVLNLLPLRAEIITNKNRKYVINSIKQTLPLLKENKIKKIIFDAYYDYSDHYWDYDLQKYVKSMNLTRVGYYDSEAEVVGDHVINNIKWYSYNVLNVSPEDMSNFLIVEYFYNDEIYNIYAYSNTLYEYHATRRYGYDYYYKWKISKEPVQIVKETLAEKDLRDLKRYYKLTINLNVFDFV